MLPRTWQRLHPLSPIVRAGPSLFGILLVLGTAAAFRGRQGDPVFNIVIVAIAVLGGVVTWAVTRWRVDGDTLRVETGLIRRQSLQVPLSRAQAVDVVEPLLGRALGLAEVRVRTGGASHGDARLCYLRANEAVYVRAGLLAIAHGVHEAAPPPPEQRLAAVPNDAVALLQQRGVPAPRPDEKRLAKLIADLDSPQFEVRDAAGKEVAKLGKTAVPAWGPGPRAIGDSCRVPHFRQAP